MAVPRSSRLSDKSKYYLKTAIASPDLGQEIIDKLDDLRYADTSVTAAQMDTLNATPVSLVAAPGAGKVIQFMGQVVYNDFVTTAFELGTGTLDVRYQNSSGGLAGQMTNAFVESAADAYSTVAPLTCVALVNQALVLHASADVTAGAGNLKIRTYYRIVTIADIGA